MANQEQCDRVCCLEATEVDTDMGSTQEQVRRLKLFIRVCGCTIGGAILFLGLFSFVYFIDELLKSAPK